MVAAPLAQIPKQLLNGEDGLIWLILVLVDLANRLLFCDWTGR